MAWHSEHIEESIEGFDSYGFEPAAVINFLAFLGWNPGTEQEIFSLEQLIEVFDAERIHKGGARFDYDKALWFNSQYLQHLDYAIVHERLIQYAEKENINISDVNVEAVFRLLQPRLHRLKEFFTIGYYFFTDELSYDEAEINKKWNPEAGALIQKIAEALKNTEPFTAENISIGVKELIAASGTKMGIIMPLIRAALTGTIQGADVFEIAGILGNVKTIERFKKMAAWTRVG
jgi:glutamyl-tRNA synthetase